MTYFGIENFKQSILFIDNHKNYGTIAMVSFLSETKVDINELRNTLSVVIIPDDIIKKINLKNFYLKINFCYKYGKDDCFYNCFFNFHVDDKFKMYRGLSIFSDNFYHDLIIKSDNQNFNFDYLISLTTDYLNINKTPNQTIEDRIDITHQYLDHFSDIDEWAIRIRKFGSNNIFTAVSSKNESEIIRNILKIY